MTESFPADLWQQPPLSSLHLQFVPLDFVMHWHRCGLTADYFAAHMAYAFDNREVVRAVLSTVVNELLENAAKFSQDKARPASLLMDVFGPWIAIQTRNRADARRVDDLQSLFRSFEAQSAEELFMARLAGSTDGASSPSGLGLLVLKKDYAVRLASKIEPLDDGGFDVLLQAVMHTDELEAR